MSYDGSLIFDTEINTQGFQTGANKLNSIVGGLGVFKLIEKGFSLVTGSIDKAMGRIDTMEQFSRVMTTMTGDVNATNEALDETTEIVTGTAYGLDYAVGRSKISFLVVWKSRNRRKPCVLGATQWLSMGMEAMQLLPA